MDIAKEVLEYKNHLRVKNEFYLAQVQAVQKRFNKKQAIPKTLSRVEVDELRENQIHWTQYQDKRK